MPEIVPEVCSECQGLLVELWNGPHYNEQLFLMVSDEEVAVGDFFEIDDLPLNVCLKCDPDWKRVSMLVTDALRFESDFLKTKLTNQDSAQSALQGICHAREKREEALLIATRLIKKQGVKKHPNGSSIQEATKWVRRRPNGSATVFVWVNTRFQNILKFLSG